MESKPVPSYPVDLKKIEKKDEIRKEKVKEKTYAKYDAKKDEFKFATSNRPGADDAVKARYVADVEDLK